jgi:atypical dual specificity phosphatase
VVVHNFSWLLPGELAGAAQPGDWGYDPQGSQEQLAADLAWLSAQGAGAVVSLTEEPLHTELLERQGLRYLHLPIEDMQAPSLEEVSAFVAFVDQCLAERRPVVAHCRAGLGRTGTMLACYLVHRDTDPRTALFQVRRHRPGSVETWAQEQAVYEYAAHRVAAASWGVN